MDKFLGFKTEEILTCILLVIVGYFIAKMFSRCGCIDGFSVGIAKKDNADCKSGDSCTFTGDSGFEYECPGDKCYQLNIDVEKKCISAKNKNCQTPEQGYECDGEKKLYCKKNCNEIKSTSGQKSDYGYCLKPPAPPPPGPPGPPPAVDRCRSVAGLNDNWIEDKEDYRTNSCSYDSVYINAKEKGQDVLCCVNANECVENGSACTQKNMEDTIKNKGNNVCTNSKYGNISGKFPGPNNSQEYDSRPVNCWYISDSDPLWSDETCDKNNSRDTKGHGLGCYYLEGDAPQPTNDCDIAVATQWKNIICNTKTTLDGSMSGSQTYNTIQQKLQNIKDKDNPSLSPFSFDHKDINAMGCGKYTDNNYCIQGVQGTATCKAKDGSKQNDVEYCKNLTPVTETRCKQSASCVWRIPNLTDDVEEFSEQPGACSRKCTQPGGCTKSEETEPQIEKDCKDAKNLLWCSNSNTGNSILGELNIVDIIGSNYDNLQTYCNQPGYMPYTRLPRSPPLAS